MIQSRATRRSRRDEQKKKKSSGKNYRLFTPSIVGIDFWKDRERERERWCLEKSEKSEEKRILMANEKERETKKKESELKIERRRRRRKKNERKHVRWEGRWSNCWDIYIYLSPLEVLFSFFFFFFEREEGSENRAGDSPCKKDRVFEKKKEHTHTHSQWIVIVLGVCLARRTIRVESILFDFVCCEQPSMRHVDFARVRTNNACDILVCARIRAVNNMSGYSYVPSGQSRDRDSSNPSFLPSIVEIKRCFRRRTKNRSNSFEKCDIYVYSCNHFAYFSISFRKKNRIARSTYLVPLPFSTFIISCAVRVYSSRFSFTKIHMCSLRCAN